MRILVEDDDEALLQSIANTHEEKDVEDVDMGTAHSSSRTIYPVPHSSSSSPFEEGTSVNIPASIPVERVQSASHISSFKVGTVGASFSDNDSSSGSDNDSESRHAKVETAAESVFNFGLVFNHRRTHPHHHHHRNHVACSYGSLANLSVVHADVSPDFDLHSTAADDGEHRSPSTASHPLYHSSGKY